MGEFAGVADIVRMSDVDFEYLYGNNDYAGRAATMLEAGASLVVITQGVKGVQAWHGKAGALQVETPKVEVVDTIGAGDSFQAALLYALWTLGQINTETLGKIDAVELRRVLSFAAACAAITCGRVGADPPWLGDITQERNELLWGA
jgi:fructokinase